MVKMNSIRKVVTANLQMDKKEQTDIKCIKCVYILEHLLEHSFILETSKYIYQLISFGHKYILGLRTNHKGYQSRIL